MTAYGQVPPDVGDPDKWLAQQDAALALDNAHATYRRWLGHTYDTDALDASLAAVAVERMDGEPLWILIVGGPGAAKTETVSAVGKCGAIVVSTIASEGALLSASPQKSRTRNATGGLLRQVEPRGVLVVKDVTSILSMNRDIRGQVLAAMREVYDGRWDRNVGVDGGQTLTWTGRIAVIGAVTSAWDAAHAVISAMGDRFALVRLDTTDTTERFAVGRQAVGNTGHESHMRAELTSAAAQVLARMSPQPANLTDDEVDAILDAANLVTLARTNVTFDYRGDPIDADSPEAPTRFAKQLVQVVRGGCAIGLPRQSSLRLAVRVARDSMPPLRLAILDDVAANPDSTAREVCRRLDKPRTTVDRQLQALHLLGVLTVTQVEDTFAGREITRWLYRLREGIKPEALIVPSAEPDLSPHLHVPTKKRGEGDVSTDTAHTPTDKTGTGRAAS